VPQDLVADAVVVRDPVLGEQSAEGGVELLAVALESQEERHVVEAGDVIVDLGGRPSRGAGRGPGTT